MKQTIRYDRKKKRLNRLACFNGLRLNNFCIGEEHFVEVFMYELCWCRAQSRIWNKASKCQRNFIIHIVFPLPGATFTRTVTTSAAAKNNSASTYYLRMCLWNSKCDTGNSLCCCFSLLSSLLSFPSYHDSA